ncbi:MULTISPECIES: sulfatase-like hydrolase/transferase [Primorskyibacter]|uniref:Arylsulfatase A n=1 Tax=Primorskyibacter flagellatus TaxID=1387277 RepID=A0A1W2EKW4_9RHOB|nr:MULTISPECIES: sulfatase-like hydrolase/transferase [Primorskyibacter]SMD10360.1 Arylsulfatase A [Primorskyibacter flagellatus]
MSIRKKNILLIYADQWRHDQFGSKRSYTPNLDALAREAVSFRQHFTQVLPCAPSRASLFTGLYAQTHRVLKNRTPLNARHKTIAHYLRDSGYAPTLFGYTDTTLDPREFSEGDPRRGPGYQPLPGFEVGCHQPDNNPHEWLAHLRAEGVEYTDHSDVYDPDRTRANATGGAAGYPAKYRAEDSDTAYLTDRLMSWQREQAEGWCAALCYLRPHNPTIAPEPYNSLVNPADLAPPIRAEDAAEEAAAHPYLAHQIAQGDAGASVHQDLAGRIAEVDEQDWRSIRAIHLALMAEIDANLGRLFDQLKQTGQWEDTLILFSSDHGEMMFDHYLCQQASWHDQCTHVPLIIRAPGAQFRASAGHAVEALSEAVDTIPTLLDWLGCEVPGHLDGRSLLPFLKGESPADWRDHVVWEFTYRNAVTSEYLSAHGLDDDDCVMTVIRDKRFKHAFFPGSDPVLIDLESDQHELRNIASDPEYAAVERRYLARQMRNRIRHSDRILPPPPAPK